jgi:hypothetical protein
MWRQWHRRTSSGRHPLFLVDNDGPLWWMWTRGRSAHPTRTGPATAGAERTLDEDGPATLETERALDEDGPAMPETRDASRASIQDKHKRLEASASSRL